MEQDISNRARSPASQKRAVGSRRRPRSPAAGRDPPSGAQPAAATALPRRPGGSPTVPRVGRAGLHRSRRSSGPVDPAHRRTHLSPARRLPVPDPPPSYLLPLQGGPNRHPQQTRPRRPRRRHHRHGREEGARPPPCLAALPPPAEGRLSLPEPRQGREVTHRRQLRAALSSAAAAAPLNEAGCARPLRLAGGKLRAALGGALLRRAEPGRCSRLHPPPRAAARLK